MEEESLNEIEKKELLSIARLAVMSRLEGKKEQLSTDLAGLKIHGGAFVTIHKRGELRGCIGLFESARPLFETVADMAQSAAFRDPRFSPLSPDEAGDIDFEISVLSPLREIGDVSEIKLGIHGIYITKGYNRGVLLPQVAAEQGWDRDTFLAHTCLKAGLPEDAWREGAKIEIFSAQVFGDLEETGL